MSDNITQHKRTMTDREALDALALFMARPGQWNGGDVCEVAAEVIGATGRPHPGDSDYDTVDGVIDESGEEVSPEYVNALAEFHITEDANTQ